MTNKDIQYMQQALDLAVQGMGSVSPNPMVGAVIVSTDGRVIGRGWHKKHGGPHAEVEAVASVSAADRGAIRGATMYVNLEPCSHWGRTPPCADMIVEQEFGRVVVGCLDSNPQVAGRGVARITQAGIEVEVGVLEAQAKELNRRFLTNHTLNRPYIILKWAQTSDGFLDAHREVGVAPVWMTGPRAKSLVHKWRAQEDAIMVGTTTALLDDPRLTVRVADVGGRNPLRVVVDRTLRLPSTLNIFNSEASTLLFTDRELANSAILKFEEHDYVEVAGVDFHAGDLLQQIMCTLRCHHVSSIIVEGGARLLGNFIEQGLWDEARVFASALSLADLYPNKGYTIGVPAPLDFCKHAGVIEPVDGYTLYKNYDAK